MKQVILRREARADVLDAFRWYEEQKPGLGDEFRDELRAFWTIGRGSHCLDRSSRRAGSETRDRDARRQPVNFAPLDTVVLERDMPEHGLRRGDLGAVVEVYEPDGLEVEFVRASGRTQALVELTTRDVRAIRDEDLISVRTLDRTA